MTDPYRDDRDARHWLRVAGIAIAIAVLLVVVLMLVGGGHGPGRHMHSGDPVATASVRQGDSG